MRLRSLVLIAACAPALAFAQEPAIVLPHVGRLLTSADEPVDGDLKMRFSLYKSARPPESSADTAWWEGTETTVHVTRGVYQVMLGQFSAGTGALPVSAFTGNGERWLGVTVEGVPLLPRLLVGSVPYAYFAERAGSAQAAESLGAGCAGCVATAHLADGAVTLAKLGADGNGKVAGLGADTLDGRDGADFALASHDHDARYVRQDAGGALSGPLTLPGAPTSALHAATKGYVDEAVGEVAADLAAYVKRDGLTTLTGPLTLSGPPTAAAHAASKGWVDGRLDEYVRKDQAVLDLGTGGQLKLGADGKLVVGSVTLDEALLGRLRDLASPVADTQEDARTSCAAIKAAAPFSRDGVYWIDPSGGDKGDAFRVYCDMTTDGGGWTLVSRVVYLANIASTGAVGTTPILPGQSSFAKLSDATINQIRASGDYTGPTDIRMTCEFSTAMTMYVSSACSFGSNNVVNTTANCGQCSRTFQGSLTSLSPNEGTRGFGHHHSTGWFAYQSTHYSSQGCHADEWNGTNSGNASGTMWVK